LARSKSIRPRSLHPRMASNKSAAPRRGHGKETAERAELPRLFTQRSRGHRSRAIVKAGTYRCDRVDAVDLAQVNADLDPRRLTIRTVPTLIRKSKAWADYCDAERPLDHAIRRLGKARRAA
jgi:DNA primase